MYQQQNRAEGRSADAQARDLQLLQQQQDTQNTQFQQQLGIYQQLIASQEQNAQQYTDALNQQNDLLNQQNILSMQMGQEQNAILSAAYTEQNRILEESGRTQNELLGRQTTLIEEEANRNLELQKQAQRQAELSADYERRVTENQAGDVAAQRNRLAVSVQRRRELQRQGQLIRR